jgi:hypothetical protein
VLELRGAQRGDDAGRRRRAELLLQRRGTLHGRERTGDPVSMAP